MYYSIQHMAHGGIKPVMWISLLRIRILDWPCEKTDPDPI